MKFFKALRIAWYMITDKEQSNRYQIRNCSGFRKGYEVVDTHFGGVFKHERYKLLKHEAQAVADALNEVVPPLK